MGFVLVSSYETTGHFARRLYLPEGGASHQRPFTPQNVVRSTADGPDVEFSNHGVLRKRHQDAVERYKKACERRLERIVQFGIDSDSRRAVSNHPIIEGDDQAN